MNAFFNWHDTWIVAQHNWYWIAFAFCAGVFFAWRSTRISTSREV